MDWRTLDGVECLTSDDGEVLAAVVQDRSCAMCRWRPGLAMTLWRVMLEPGYRLLPDVWQSHAMARKQAERLVARRGEQIAANMAAWEREAKEPRR